MSNPFSTAAKLLKTQKLADELQKDANTMNKTNWKTNSLGIATIVLAIAATWGPPSVQQKLHDTQLQVNALAGLLGVGLLAAKDHDN